VHSRAAFRHYVLSPLVAAPLTLITAAGAAMASSLLVHMGLAAHGAVQTGIALGVSAVLGYAGGQSAGRDGPSDRAYQRGARVAESADHWKSSSVPRVPGKAPPSRRFSMRRWRAATVPSLPILTAATCGAFTTLNAAMS
jgi:hypothetical protein